jgi:hypothetical protein
MSRHVLALLLLCGTAAMAQSPGYWAFVRSETFASDPYLGDALCPGEVIRIDQIDSRVVKVIHTVPASCNYNKATVEQHRHEWTELQNTIAVGEVPKFTATSTVIELTNTTGPFGGTTIFCGFVAYDAADKVSPTGTSRWGIRRPLMHRESGRRLRSRTRDARRRRNSGCRLLPGWGRAATTA